MRFDHLYEKLAKVLPVEERPNPSGRPNCVIRVPKGLVKVRVGDYGSGIDDAFVRKRSDTFSEIVAVSRHFVTKPLYRITVSHISDEARFSVVTTNDHTCAVYDKTKSYPDGGCHVTFKAAKELKVGDEVPFQENPIQEDIDEYTRVCSEGDGRCGWNREQCCWFGANGEKYNVYSCDGVATVVSVEELDNSEGCWVYDLEVASGRHVYYANGILVHNSQFVNLAPITQKFCREAGIPESTTMANLPDDVRKRVIGEAYRILDRVNENVRKLIDENAHTSQGNALHYALEYIASEGMYFAKKCYIVHKIEEDGFPCDKFKYSGVAVKKAEIPPSMKTFLKDVYQNTMTRDSWTERDYIDTVNRAYETFRSLGWEDVAYYRKYRTKKEPVFVKDEETGKMVQTFESEKGALSFVRGINIWNALLEQHGLGGKYPSIYQGDELRWAYVLPTNRYNIDVIAFKDGFPTEFEGVFSLDYNKMFNNIFTRPLDRYVGIMGYATHDPKQQTENPDFEIF